MSLTVGRITYANCIPWFYYLRDCGFDGTIVDGVPSELNRRLAVGELDLCPSSSIEYAQHAADYMLLPGHSISAIGAVQSVLLFTPISLSELSGIPIALTGESATSVALLRVLLREFVHLPDVITEVPTGPVEALIASGRPALLIGDRALRMAKQAPPGVQVVDLGALWHHFTGLPFVFALWIVRRETAILRPEDLRLFLAQLDTARARTFADLSRVAETVAEREWMGTEGLVRYWRSVSYAFDAAHIEGLRCFYTLLEKQGEILQAPELDFFGESEAR
jgi:chorismate dehydratase